MKSLLVLLVATLLGPNPVAAQNDEFFTVAELYQALSWGMTDSEAKQLAKYMTDDPAVVATIPTLSEIGPIASNYSEDMLILLSFVSKDANKKVEKRLADLRHANAWNQDDQARWDKRRAEIQSQLVEAGKLPK